MSPNKKGVYSEFTININEVIKNDSHVALVPGDSINPTRLGGRVKFSSGKIGLYYVTGQNMPLVGCQYLLFLTYDQEAGFAILTGYELREGQVFPLDKPGVGHPFTKYQGASETSLLNEVRAAVANPSQL